MLKSDEELFNETMEDVDNILKGKKLTKHITESARAIKREERTQYIFGILIAIIGIPFAIVFWFFWEFVPSFGVLVMISLCLAFPIKLGVNYFFPDLLDLYHVWGVLSYIALIWLLSPLLNKRIL